MKVRIVDISPKGLHVTEELPLEPLNERMRQGKSQGVIFTAAPRVDATIFGNTSGAELKGTITSKYRQECSLCLEEKERTVTINTHFHLKQKPEGSEIEDDIGIVYYEGEHADLDEVLQEELILSLSLYWHPPFDNDERCKECLKRRSELGLASQKTGATLGDLLKKKLVN